MSVTDSVKEFVRQCEHTSEYLLKVSKSEEFIKLRNTHVKSILEIKVDGED